MKESQRTNGWRKRVFSSIRFATASALVAGGILVTAKVGDAGKLGAASMETSHGQLMRWHALRNPTSQEVSDLRKICPPGETSPEADVEIAGRLLRDRVLYAQAVQAGTQQAAAAR